MTAQNTKPASRIAQLRRESVGVSKFEQAELPGVPGPIRDRIQLFMEGISEFNLLRSMPTYDSVQAAVVINPMPVSLFRLFYATSLEDSVDEAKSFHRKGNSFLSRLMRKERVVPDYIMNEGYKACRDAAARAGRAGGFGIATQKASLVAMSELSRKRPLPDEILLPIIDSAAFVCAVRTIVDLDFPEKSLYLGHAMQRWFLIEAGLAIYMYDRQIPYIIAATNNGNVDADRTGGGGGAPSLEKA